MNIISKLLVEYREYYILRQADMVEELIAYSKDFAQLNTVTLSRWETGTTTPSIQKKKTLLHFFTAKHSFDNSPIQSLMQAQYENLYTSLSSVFTRNYQFLIGNLPTPNDTQNALHHLQEYSNKKEHIEHIIDIEKATTATGYYRLSQEMLERWTQYPSTFAIICERKKQHLGHFIMIKVKNDIAQEIIHYQKSPFFLEEKDFCTIDEKGTYLVHALYGRNPDIAALLNVKAYLYLFKHMETIDNLAILSVRTDGILLTKDYGIQMITSGKDNTYGFEWHGMSSPIKDILFSDTIVKLVF